MLGRERLVLLGLVLAVCVNNANFSATTVALPSIQKSFDLGFSGLQWTMTAYLVSYAALMLAGGRLADVFGLRTVLVAGTLLYLAALLVVATAPVAGVLLAGRALQGVAAALIKPTTTSAARARFSGPAQTAAIGMVVGMSAIAQAAGPPLGGILTRGLGWRSVFLVNVPLLLVAAGLAWAMLPRERTRSGRADLGGTALFASALALFTVALSQGGDDGYRDPLVLGLFAAAAVASAAFAAHLRRRADALVDLDSFRSRTLLVSTVVGFTMTLTLAAVLFFEALYLERARGYGTMTTGLLFLPMTALFGALSTRAEWVERRFGRRLPAAAGLSCAALGALVLALDSPGATIARPLAALFLIGLGLGVSWAHVTSVGLRAAPPNRSGRAAGILFTARWIGGTVGIALLSVVYRALSDERLKAALGDGAGRATRARLDGLLSGTSSGRSALASLPADLQPPALLAVHDAAAGTAWALGGVAAVAALGAVLCLRLPRTNG